MSFCPHCGARLQEGSVSCPRCGQATFQEPKKKTLVGMQHDKLKAALALAREPKEASTEAFGLQTKHLQEKTSAASSDLQKLEESSEEKRLKNIALLRRSTKTAIPAYATQTEQTPSVVSSPASTHEELPQPAPEDTLETKAEDSVEKTVQAQPILALSPESLPPLPEDPQLALAHAETQHATPIATILRSSGKFSTQPQDNKTDTTDSKKTISSSQLQSIVTQGAPSPTTPEPSEPNTKQQESTPVDFQPQNTPSKEGGPSPMLGESLMLRPGDVVDPVTGAPLRIMPQKNASKAPWIIFGVLLLLVAGLAYYVFTRPPELPPIKLIEQYLSTRGKGSYELVIDTSAVVGLDALKIAGKEAKVEEGKAKLSLPNNAVALGENALETKGLYKGDWVDLPPTNVNRLALFSVDVDEKKKEVAFSVEVVEGATAVNFLGKDYNTTQSKTKFTLPLGELVGKPGKDEKEVEKRIAFALVGTEGDGEVELLLPALTSSITIKSPKDKETFDKKTDLVELVFTAPDGAKPKVLLNDKEISANKQGKYNLSLSAGENTIEVKTDAESAKITVTREGAQEEAPKKKRGR